MTTKNSILKIQWRYQLTATDVTAITEIVRLANVFNEEEIECATQLAIETLQDPSRGYYFLFAEHDNKVIAYTCYGPITLTDHSFDLYWIAVDPQYQQHKVGQQLLNLTEQAITAMHGKQVYIETSTREIYRPAQNFYLKNGYTIMVELADFYRENDGKIIYRKIL